MSTLSTCSVDETYVRALIFACGHSMSVKDCTSGGDAETRWDNDLVVKITKDPTYNRESVDFDCPTCRAKKSDIDQIHEQDIAELQQIAIRDSRPPYFHGLPPAMIVKTHENPENNLIMDWEKLKDADKYRIHNPTLAEIDQTQNIPKNKRIMEWLAIDEASKYDELIKPGAEKHTFWHRLHVDDPKSVDGPITNKLEHKIPWDSEAGSILVNQIRHYFNMPIPDNIPGTHPSKAETLEVLYFANDTIKRDAKSGNRRLPQNRRITDDNDGIIRYRCSQDHLRGLLLIYRKVITVAWPKRDDSPEEMEAAGNRSPRSTDSFSSEPNNSDEEAEEDEEDDEDGDDDDSEEEDTFRRSFSQPRPKICSSGYVDNDSNSKCSQDEEENQPQPDCKPKEPVITIRKTYARRKERKIGKGKTTKAVPYRTFRMSNLRKEWVLEEGGGDEKNKEG